MIQSDQGVRIILDMRVERKEEIVIYEEQRVRVEEQWKIKLEKRVVVRLWRVLIVGWVEIFGYYFRDLVFVWYMFQEGEMILFSDLFIFNVYFVEYGSSFELDLRYYSNKLFRGNI